MLNVYETYHKGYTIGIGMGVPNVDWSSTSLVYANIYTKAINIYGVVKALYRNYPSYTPYGVSLWDSRYSNIYIFEFYFWFNSRLHQTKPRRDFTDHPQLGI